MPPSDPTDRASDQATGRPGERAFERAGESPGDSPADRPNEADADDAVRKEALWSGPWHARRRLVLLHGWGADADDLLELGEALVEDLSEVGVVALRAPGLHPAGTGRQWYDLQQPGWPELPQARQQLRARLRALGDSVPLEHTALLGFSQGAAMALDVGCGDSAGADGLPLASLVACSGYPHPGWRPRRPSGPLLLTHGREDPVVPFAASEAIEEMVKAAGGSVQRCGFSGGHGIDPALFPTIRAALAAGWA